VTVAWPGEYRIRKTLKKLHDDLVDMWRIKTARPTSTGCVHENP